MWGLSWGEASFSSMWIREEQQILGVERKEQGSFDSLHLGAD